MAQLTWRNVEAPSFAGVNQAQAASAAALNTAFKSASDALGKYGEIQRDGASSKLMADVLALRDPAAIDAALANGSLFAGRDMTNITPEALKFIAGSKGTLLDNAQTVASTEGTRANTANTLSITEERRAKVVRDEAEKVAQANYAAETVRLRQMGANGTPEGRDAAIAGASDPAYAKRGIMAGVPYADVVGAPNKIVEENTTSHRNINSGLATEENVTNAREAAQVKEVTDGLVKKYGSYAKDYVDKVPDLPTNIRDAVKRQVINYGATNAPVSRPDQDAVRGMSGTPASGSPAAPPASSLGSVDASRAAMKEAGIEFSGPAGVPAHPMTATQDGPAPASPMTTGMPNADVPTTGSRQASSVPTDGSNAPTGQVAPSVRSFTNNVARAAANNQPTNEFGPAPANNGGSRSFEPGPVGDLAPVSPAGRGPTAGSVPRTNYNRKGGDFSQQYDTTEQRYGLPRGYLDRTAFIESKGDPSAKNPGSSAGGLFQFIDGTARQYGLRDRYNPDQAIEAAGRLARDNANVLRRGLGREPTAAELYLAHQQGSGGALKLLRNPNASAVDVVGAKQVSLNGGKAGMTAGQFAGLWLNKFNSNGGGNATGQSPSVYDIPTRMVQSQNVTIPTPEQSGASVQQANIPAPAAQPSQGQFNIPGAMPPPAAANTNTGRQYSDPTANRVAANLQRDKRYDAAQDQLLGMEPDAAANQVSTSFTRATEHLKTNQNILNPNGETLQALKNIAANPNLRNQPVMKVAEDLVAGPLKDLGLKSEDVAKRLMRLSEKTGNTLSPAAIAEIVKTMPIAVSKEGRSWLSAPFAGRGHFDDKSWFGEDTSKLDTGSIAGKLLGLIQGNPKQFAENFNQMIRKDTEWTNMQTRSNQAVEHIKQAQQKYNYMKGRAANGYPVDMQEATEEYREVISNWQSVLGNYQKRINEPVEGVRVPKK